MPCLVAPAASAVIRVMYGIKYRRPGFIDQELCHVIWHRANCFGQAKMAVQDDN